LASTTPELDDALWAQVAALVPPIRRWGDQPPLDQRMILAGILWVMRTGSSWRDLPACFGYWETIRDYYHRWKQHGHWQRLLAVLQTAPAPEAQQVSL
jgi:transposase